MCPNFRKPMYLTHCIKFEKEELNNDKVSKTITTRIYVPLPRGRMLTNFLREHHRKSELKQKYSFRALRILSRTST